MDPESASSSVTGGFWLWSFERLYGVLFCFVFGFPTIGSDVSLETATTCILDWQLHTAIPTWDFRTYSVYTCVGLRVGRVRRDYKNSIYGALEGEVD